MILKRQILLNYQGENHIYYRPAPSDLKALLLAIRQLEKDLGKVPGSLTNYFKYKPHSWEVKIL